LRALMSLPATNLEPAERDPRKLRKTALILVGLMVVSAVGVLYAYMGWSEQQAADDRPAIIARLGDDMEFGVVRQDSSGGKLSDLYGDVWVIHAVCPSQPESWKATREVIQRLNKHYEGRKDFHIVTFSIDADKDGPEVMLPLSKELGGDLPKWWFASAGQTYVHKFLKNTLKGGIMPYQKDGKWIYDPVITVIDRDRHIRQATLRIGKYRRQPLTFDFEQAANWDSQKRTEGLQKSNVETMEDLLYHTIDQLLSHPVTKP
jgi:cytochrome oxidase Cu insertion factor (SCO1/SenC/PrrC family)